jgi:hypothetical protein
MFGTTNQLIGDGHHLISHYSFFSAFFNIKELKPIASCERILLAPSLVMGYGDELPFLEL